MLIAPAAGYFKTASNFIIALHVITAVKETEQTKKGEDLNFVLFTMIATGKIENLQAHVNPVSKV